jgi:hypothetical protein
MGRRDLPELLGGGVFQLLFSIPQFLFSSPVLVQYAVRGLIISTSGPNRCDLPELLGGGVPALVHHPAVPMVTFQFWFSMRGQGIDSSLTDWADVIYLNYWVAVFQLLFTIPLVVPSAYVSNLAVRDIVPNLRDGAM